MEDIVSEKGKEEDRNYRTVILILIPKINVTEKQCLYRYQQSNKA